MSTDSRAANTQPDWGRLERASLLAAAGGALAFVILAFTPLAGRHPLTQAATSYLVAFTFWLACPVGCLVVLMTHYLTGGAWGVVLRPVLEAGSRTMILLLLLFIPVGVAAFLTSASPYPWARPLEEVASGTVLVELQQKTVFLNPIFFLVRTALYFGCWLALVYFLRAWSTQWKAGDAAAGARLPAISGPGLVLYAITITFASMDWVMSLEPFWHSTIYPPIYAIGQVNTGFAFATIAIIFLSRFPPLAGRVKPKHFRDLGGLMLTFLMLWAYFAFSQFLLIWIGNLPDELPYYLKRMRGGWEWVGTGLIVLHFALPFLLLLFRGVKDHPSRLIGVAIGILVIRFVDILWWIEPSFPHDGEPGLYWLLDVAALVALGGIWVWWFLGNLQQVSLEPFHGADQCEVEVAHA